MTLKGKLLMALRNLQHICTIQGCSLCMEEGKKLTLERLVLRDLRYLESILFPKLGMGVLSSFTSYLARHSSEGCLSI